DEPDPGAWDFLAPVAALLRANDPDHPPWNNLLGPGGFATRAAWENYVRAYMLRFQPVVLCDDYYEFFQGYDRGLFIENAAGLNALARERGIPFWAIVLLTAHGPYRIPTEGELKWQVSM